MPKSGSPEHRCGKAITAYKDNFKTCLSGDLCAQSIVYPRHDQLPLLSMIGESFPLCS
jgi:hypothetical protein